MPSKVAETLKDTMMEENKASEAEAEARKSKKTEE